MYQKTEDQLQFEDFYLPFGGRLRSGNRWIQLAKLLPWAKLEEQYAANFAKSGMGAPAKPVRMALGALIIKEKCGFTDEETVEQIRENPYLQYFIGLPEYQDEPPFEASMMVHFRKRFGLNDLMAINELICEEKPSKEAKHRDDQGPDNPEGGSNAGHLILDATCAPADIRYPTDLSLLNEGREKLERIIDALYGTQKGNIDKPRTYRKKARKDYLKTAKMRKARMKTLRKAIGKQLRYVARDLRAADSLLEQVSIETLTSRQRQWLETIRRLYDQQKAMYETNTHSIENRIVSISQPHIRPIVRGKAGAECEFGAKLSISLVNGYARIERLSWDNYNESSGFRKQVEAYLSRNGCYPAAISADQIYRNRENIRYCKEHGIRLSGPRLGRPQQVTKEQKRLTQRDNRIRNAVEGKFGEGKRRYGLGRIMSKLKETGECEIGLQFLVMNLEHRLRLLFCHFFETLFLSMERLIFRRNLAFMA